MNQSYMTFGLVALTPMVLSMVLYLLEKKTKYAKVPYWVRQVICGVLFGLLAVAGTEWGVKLDEGAMVNCRDGAVLSAGLLFGGPAGIIAGFIGGIERWFCVYWGGGTFTQVACTVSTMFAGVYAALLRRYMFEGKKPGWLLSLAIGVVMEVIHMVMVFLTNMGTPERAMSVVKACSPPMIIGNGISVMLAAVVVTLLAGESIWQQKKSVHISQTVQRWLLVTVAVAFALTTFFVFQMQDTIANSQVDDLLELAVEEVANDVKDASDANMISVTRKVKELIAQGDPLEMIAYRNNITEISIINKEGFIADSTNPDFVGFDMRSGSQARAFLCLLGTTQEYVQEYGPITYSNSNPDKPKIWRKYAGIKTSDGFIQVGYDALQFRQDISRQVKGISRNRHVSKTGYIIVVDENLNVVSVRDNVILDREVLKSIPKQKRNVTLATTVEGENIFYRIKKAEGYYLISVLPEAEAMQVRNIVLYVNAFMEIIVFAILFVLIYLLIKRVVVNRIKEVNSSLSKITDGDLNEVVNVRSSEEFASLSDDINSTVDTLKHYIDEASARIDKELEFAKSIQRSALPTVTPALAKRHSFEIYARMNAAKEVGGDFYDFYLTHRNTLNCLIADVSGKGIPAAMFMMRAKTELRSRTETDMPINEVFTKGNETLCDGNDAGMFVTAWQGCLDLETGLMKFANAGHNPPLVRHKNGKFEYLKSRTGFVLAGMDGVVYKPQELQLERGDILYLYTDGVTEATNAHEELYGEERLLTILNSREFESMQDLCDSVKADVDAFVGEAPQFDDITMLALKYNGKNINPHIRFEEASIEDIPAVTEFVEAELEKLEVPMKAVIQLNVAIDEIYSNIAKFAYPKGPGQATVTVIAQNSPRAVCLEFTDHGIPYNPLTRDDPDITLSAEERSIGGLGIYMVKKTMDDFRYRYEDDKNILTIVKEY